MSETSKLVKEIREGLSQKSSSQKDETRVMQCMLNDKEYNVGVYGAAGKVGEYCPAQDARKMAASIISSTTSITKDEAASLADAHQFSKAEATAMVGISKEFVNTYGQTTRKLPLGGRENSNVVLQGVEVEASTTRYPKKVGIDSEGKGIYESTVKSVPAHNKIKASAPCPSWVK
jgi:hypothetical protein